MREKGQFGEKNTLLTCVYVLFGVMMTTIVGICMFLAGMEYARKDTAHYQIPNVILVIFGVAAIFGLYWVMRRIAPRWDSCKRKHLVILAVSIAFFALQVFMAYNYYFKTDWDAQTVAAGAIEAGNGDSIAWANGYYSTYPNNLMLLYLFSTVVRVFTMLGMYHHAYASLILLQCGISWIAGLLLFYSILRLKNSAMAMLSYVLYGLLIGFSPWVSIPYSDSVTLFFPVAILWIYLRKPEKPHLIALKWFAIALLSYVGFKFKPQALIIAIAIALVGLIVLLHEKKWSAKNTVRCGAFVCGMLCGVLVVSATTGTLELEIDREQTLGLPHFFMMGMNAEEMGVYSQNDVDFSMGIETAEERTQQNLQVARERIQGMGVSGLLKLFTQKTLTNYNDGTFCWGGEGIFYGELIEEKDDIITPLLRSIYYNRHVEGALYPVWSHFAQAIWMAVLALSIFAVLGKKNAPTAILMLTIVGVTIFETVFEARARYLYLYVPIYITLAVCGAENLYQKALSWKKMYQVRRGQ